MYFWPCSVALWSLSNISNPSFHLSLVDWDCHPSCFCFSLSHVSHPSCCLSFYLFFSFPPNALAPPTALFLSQTQAQIPCKLMQMTSRAVWMSLRSAKVWVGWSKAPYREATYWCPGLLNSPPYSSLRMWCWSRWDNPSGICSQHMPYMSTISVAHGIAANANRSRSVTYEVSQNDS